MKLIEHPRMPFKGRHEQCRYFSGSTLAFCRALLFKSLLLHLPHACQDVLPQGPAGLAWKSLQMVSW